MNARELVAEAIDNSPDAVAIVEASVELPSERRLIYVNRGFETFYDCNRDDAIGQTTHEFFRTRISREDFGKTNEALKHTGIYRQTRRVMRRNDPPIWVEVEISPIPCEDPHRMRWIHLSRDVTETRRLQSRMAQLVSAVEHASDFVAIYVLRDDEWYFDYVNDAFAAATGYAADELVGMRQDALVAPSTGREQLARYRAPLLQGQTVRAEIALQRKNGEEFLVEFNSRALREESTGQYTTMVSVLRDVTEKKQREATLEHQAQHDHLTGTYNRRYLERALREAASVARHGGADHALLFVEVGDFKRIYERFGQEAGDRAFAEVATALQSCVLGSDVFARYGGEEFCALLYHCSVQNAQRAAQRMLDAIASGTAGSTIDVSVGVVAVRGNFSDTIKRADQARALAKKSGRNKICVL
ncbi:MAG: diguanylate cyclase [Candidatus Eremiobacteraeota bacterium]|nr:diguanylate cyclase [Candidatus Eremiobacteraeota bacterium]